MGAAQQASACRGRRFWSLAQDTGFLLILQKKATAWREPSAKGSMLGCRVALGHLGRASDEALWCCPRRAGMTRGGFRAQSHTRRHWRWAMRMQSAVGRAGGQSGRRGRRYLGG